MNPIKLKHHFDFIIVGAGSAGCVLANRLSADPACSVLLVEAGPRDWNPLIHMPAGIAKLVNWKSLNWDYYTQPEPQLAGRRLWWPRGKVLGGSSSINAMCYIRGHQLDYEQWADTCDSDIWRWRNVLPYFIRAENNSRGADDWHGDQGPLRVTDLGYTNTLSDTFLRAAGQAGFPSNTDFNGSNQEGFAYYQCTIDQGRRYSSARAYLSEISRRRNLRVMTHTQVQQLIVDRDQVTGVALKPRWGSTVNVGTGEVLLCGGTINSPQILQRSGIGCARQLESAGVPVAHKLDGVGRNLQDHLDVCVIHKSSQAVSYDQVSELSSAWQYFVHRAGPATSNIAEAGGFIRSNDAPDQRPDFQLHFVPAQLDDHGRNRLPGSGYTVHACLLRPRSRGHIELDPMNVMGPPRIFANYLSDAEGFDMRMMQKAIDIAEKILDQPVFDAYRESKLLPGANCQSTGQREQFIRNKAESIYHPVGTCKMGAQTDPLAVVDAQLKVHGMANLRVVDASVMPTLIGGNTNAPTIMIAEKAADLILNASA